MQAVQFQGDSAELASIFHCTNCNMTFTSKDDLRTHNSSIHTFQCIQCDKSFDSDVNLQSHVQNHSDAQTFSCDKCDTVVKEEKTLRDHIIAKHNAFSIVKNCSECISCVRENELRVHCQICNNIYHKKCTEFKSKPGTWHEPSQWTCKRCLGKKDESQLNP